MLASTFVSLCASLIVVSVNAGNHQPSPAGGLSLTQSAKLNQKLLRENRIVNNTLSIKSETNVKSDVRNEEAKTSKDGDTEQQTAKEPEELPTAQALSIPVPAFLSSWFSSKPQRTTWRRQDTPRRMFDFHNRKHDGARLSNLRNSYRVTHSMRDNQRVKRIQRPHESLSNEEALLKAGHHLKMSKINSSPYEINADRSRQVVDNRRESDYEYFLIDYDLISNERDAKENVEYDITGIPNIVHDKVYRRRKQVPEKTSFGGFLTALNPINYLSAGKVSEVSKPRNEMYYNPARRLDGPVYFLDYVDYVNFDSLESYATSERNSEDTLTRASNARNPSRHDSGKVSREEVLPASHTIPSSRRYPLHIFNPPRSSMSSTGRKEKLIDYRTIPSYGYDSGHRRNIKKLRNNSFGTGSEMFELIVPSSEIKYEDYPITREDPRLEPFKYDKDFPLRDDLYIGKDGNIYLKDHNTVNFLPTAEIKSTLKDSSSNSPQMYGLDDPLYQEIIEPKTIPIKSNPLDVNSFASKMSPLPELGPDNSEDSKNNDGDEIHSFRTTSHHRPILKPYDSLKSLSSDSGSGSSPVMSNFAKTLIKNKKMLNELSGENDAN